MHSVWTWVSLTAAEWVEPSYRCKTHTVLLVLQTGLWSLGLTWATGLWQRQPFLQAGATTATWILQLVITAPVSLCIIYICNAPPPPPRTRRTSQVSEKSMQPQTGCTIDSDFNFRMFPDSKEQRNPRAVWSSSLSCQIWAGTSHLSAVWSVPILKNSLYAVPVSRLFEKLSTHGLKKIYSSWCVEFFSHSHCLVLSSLDRHWLRIWGKQSCFIKPSKL